MNMNRKVVIPCFILGVTVAWTVYRYMKTLQQRCLQFRVKANREIHIVNSTADWEKIYPRLHESCQVIKVLGFDCEWVFWGQRLPVSLIQLATHDGLCVLVRVFLLTEGLPYTLRQLLADKSILKVGVAARDDGKKLVKDYGIDVHGCVDLRHLLSRVRHFKCPNESLQGLAEGILGVTMVKDRDIRCGDWEADVLSPEQIAYAADDALIGVDIFMNMVAVKIVGKARRQRFYGSAIPTDEVAFWKTARSLCQGIVDTTYRRSKLVKDDKQDEDEQEEDSKMATDVGGKVFKMKTSKKAFMARQRPLYYNCCLVAPDGSVLTTCDIRKAQWYINKGLGHAIQDDPLWVKLNFEPAKRPTSDTDYYLQDKENVCVVCGATEEYIRKLIVPQEYRKYFPAMLKDHSSHDVLLLCISCHLHSANYDNMLRQRLAQECNAPLDSGKDSRKMQDQDLLKVVSAAKALLTNNNKIPESRVLEMEATVKNFYGVSSLSEDLLQKTLSIDYRVKNSSFVPHGKKVVDYYMKKPGGLLDFEKLWRTQFVETMQPKHLPAMWSVEHRPERLQPLTEEMRGNLVPEGYL